MNKIIVTSGTYYADIDALACAVAYSELLEKEGLQSEVVLSGNFNLNIIERIRSWDFKYKTKLKNKNNSIVIVDISNPQFFSDFIDENKIIEIFDHHFGFENYWKEKLGDKAKIEIVGACATLIWEEYKRRKQDKNISTTSANLLYTAILSNTLNFKSSVTSARDKKAFNELKNFTNLPDNWVKIYYKELEGYIYKNPQKAIIGDTKVIMLPDKKTKLTIGQLELWNSLNFIKKHKNEIEKILKSFNNEKWVLTSPSINEGINYIYTKSPDIKKLFSRLIEAKFEGDLVVTRRLWQRKEIERELLNIKP